MFPSGPRTERRRLDPEQRALLATRVQPTSASATRVLPVLPPLRELLPDGGLRRGSTISVTADLAGGATTLALALTAATSAAGSWCVAVGLSDIGALAAHDLRLDLRRVALVPWPGRHVIDAVAALIEGVDVVLLKPPPHLRPVLVRRLVARLRDRRAVLVILRDGTQWPESCDIDLQVESARWVAVGPGEDCLRRRLATVTVTGRRIVTGPRQHQLWLPAESRTVESA